MYHQVVGIPMGAEPCVFIANDTLFTYELYFIEKLIELKGWDLLKKCARTRRYIDDLITCGWPNFDEYKYSEPEATTPNVIKLKGFTHMGQLQTLN